MDTRDSKLLARHDDENDRRRRAALWRKARRVEQYKYSSMKVILQKHFEMFPLSDSEKVCVVF